MAKFIESALRQFRTYKGLGEKAMAHMTDEQLKWQPNDDSNSVAVIVQHMHGNMLSRWTDFLTTDGEKPWRMRDAEFETANITRDELLRRWNEGWDCLFAALNSITDADIDRTILIRNEPHTVLEAVNRQIAHYAYHTGQIVYIAKAASTHWVSLSIPKNGTAAFNKAKWEAREA